MAPASHRVALGLGSNLGDRRAHLGTAAAHLGQTAVSELKMSSMLETEPIDCPDDAGAYLNAAVVGYTTLSPSDLHAVCESVEDKMGRPRQRDYHDNRIIDIDILLYDDLVFDTTALQIPHIYLTCRDFVLRPLSELAPEWPVPPDNITVAAHLKSMTPGLC